MLQVSSKNTMENITIGMKTIAGFLIFKIIISPETAELAPLYNLNKNNGIRGPLREGGKGLQLQIVIV